MKLSKRLLDVLLVLAVMLLVSVVCDTCKTVETDVSVFVERVTK